MDQGYSDNLKDKLREGIKSILDEYDKIENMLYNYNRIGDQQSSSIIFKIKSDMNQTLSRYENFVNQRSYERFYSAFDGNTKNYSFNEENLFPVQNDMEANEHQENKYYKGLKMWGQKVKKGLYTAGKAVKNNTIKGYNYVKDKYNHNNNNKKEEDSSIWQSYVDNINQKSINSSQNNSLYNSQNSYNNSYNNNNNYMNNNNYRNNSNSNFGYMNNNNNFNN